MTACELEVAERDIQLNDEIMGWSCGGKFTPAQSPGRRVHSIDHPSGKVIVETPSGGRLTYHVFGNGHVETWKVRRKMPVLTTRPMYQGTARIDGPPVGRKTVPDWPLRCPRCQCAHSAVLLFQSYDCKNGCYK